MYRKLMFLISLVCFVGLSLPALGDNLEVDWGDTYVVSGTEEYDEVKCYGTIIVPAGATLVANSESEIDGDGPDGEGGSQYAKLIVDGGLFIMNDRINLGKDHDAYLIVQGGGSVIHTDSKIAIPDNDGGVHRLIIIDGTVVSNEIDLSTDSNRLAGIQIACPSTAGVIIAKLTVGNTDNDDNYDPDHWITYDVNAGKLYDYPEGGCSGSTLVINDLGDNVKEVYYIKLGPQAWDPTPSDGATNVRSSTTHVVLSWNPGNTFADYTGSKHQLYFGTDAQAVADATPSSDEYITSILHGDLYDIGVLTLWQTFYWRVDEFVRSDPVTIVPGNVWSFTTGCFLPGDVNKDCVLNFLDYAGVAETWQKQQMWPE